MTADAHTPEAVANALLEYLQPHMDAMTKAFSPGICCTFIARDPANPEAELVLGNDDMDGLMRTLRRRLPTTREAGAT